uniref:Uncharacterized protein n=1 Tax=Romanomermis culicivorax TaxID=13658 RepID=A0A915KE36_ROMCU
MDDSIKLRLIVDKALDTEEVSIIDSDRAKTPGGDLDDDSNKSVASDETKAHKEHYAQITIPDCNVAIASNIDDDLCLFLERASKWPVQFLGRKILLNSQRAYLAASSLQNKWSTDETNPKTQIDLFEKGRNQKSRLQSGLIPLSMAGIDVRT